MIIDDASKAPVSPPHPRRKGDRLGLRLSVEERTLIAEAAAAADTTVTEFVLRSATDAAHQVLADRRTFVLPAPAWEAFVAMLDHEPRSLPRLVELLGEPSLFE
jgi:uncharacterized protein (DUF1778 family)